MHAIDRARLSLDGLSVGDTFGERFFGPPEDAVLRILTREVPPAPWSYTDDTEMALSIFDVLAEHGEIRQDVLAASFANRMQPGRGYGAGAYEILAGIRAGGSWRTLARAGFDGMGSFGNGAAMRVGPLGGYFAESPIAEVAEQARLSAAITHAHAEGIAGAVAIAVACALAWQRRNDSGPLGDSWLAAVRDQVPPGHTREGIDEAIGVDRNAHVVEAAKVLGNGSRVSAPDTIPLCLWVAAYREDFAEALWTTVAALGDRDTTCAIVGSIVALRVGRSGIPAEWLRAREQLPIADTNQAE